MFKTFILNLFIQKLTLNFDRRRTGSKSVTEKFWGHLGLISMKIRFSCWQIYIAVNRYHIGEKKSDNLIFASQLEWVQF